MRRMIAGRDIKTVVEPVVRTLENDSMPKDYRGEKRHLDAHDRANLIVMLKLSLEILDLEGNGGQCFGPKFRETNPTEEKVLVNSLARAIKVGIRI